MGAVGNAGRQAKGGILRFALILGVPLCLLVAPLLAITMLGGGSQLTKLACAPVNTVPGRVSPGGPVTGTVSVVQANLPTKAGYRNTGPGGMRTIVASDPDFITMNERYAASVRSLTSAVAGYSAYRDNSHDPLNAGGGATENVVAWNATRWKDVGHGRERLITRGKENRARGRVQVRSRYATWVVLQSTTNSAEQIVVVAIHMPVNPRITHQAASYGRGMDTLISLMTEGDPDGARGTRTGPLDSYGPVIVAGDVNYHDSQHQPWGATSKMRAVGYGFVTSGEGIDDVFYPLQARVVSVRGIRAGRASDHPTFTLARLAMNGAGPKAAGGVDAETTSTTQASNAPVAATGLPKVEGFSEEQVKNAAQIVAAGKALNVPPRGLAIGLMTAYGESTLHNVDHGDTAGPDSRGLFQQRTSWGSLTDRLNPYTAATAFFKALLKVPGWQGMAPTQAAHAVQANADPNYYAPYWETGLKLYAALQGTSAAALANPVVANCTSGTGDSGTSQIAFTTSGTPYVGEFQPVELMARAQAFVDAKTSDPYFHTVNGSWFRKCQHFVANLSGRATSGFGTAADGWSHFVSTGAAHPATAPDGQAPPVGAWLYWRSAFNPAGHVTVYLGNGKSASTDLPVEGRVGIVPADAPATDWHQTYLGWAAPWAAPGTGSKG